MEVEIFSTGEEFRKALRERHYDLIFLNVVMKDRSRIELGKFIRGELGSDVNMVVYMLAYGDEYVLDLFWFQSLRFLKKSIRPEDSQNVSYKVCEKIEGDAGVFEFKSSRTVHRIPLRDILYFEGGSRRAKIAIAGHTYHHYPTLENLFSKINMEEAGFIWLHKSYAVNLRYMATFNVRMVTLLDGSELTVNVPSKENASGRYKGYASETGMGPGDEFRE